MKPLIPVKFMLPLGILILTGGIILKRYANLPDFAGGIMNGFGIGMLIIALITLIKERKSAKKDAAQN